MTRRQPGGKSTERCSRWDERNRRIREQMHLIKKFAAHDEWYLREAAFWALDGLREFITADEFRRLANLYANELRVFARSSYDAGFREIVKGAKVTLEPDTLAAVAQILGVRCVAAPIRDFDGEIFAAIGISAPSVRLPKRRFNDAGQEMNAMAAAVSAKLGHVRPVEQLDRAV